MEKTEYYNPIPTNGRITGLYKYSKNNLDHDVRKLLNLNSKLKEKGITKIIIPSNIVDIYTRLEILLRIKFSGQTDTFTEALDLIDELYKRGELQTEQQYRIALHKFHTQ